MEKSLFAQDFDVEEIMNEEIMLLAPGAIQNKFLNLYRLTDEFKKLYGEYIFDNYPKGAGVRDAVEAFKKYKGLDQVDIYEYKDRIIDFIYCKMVLGFMAYEYFSYDLENKSMRERLDFMTNRDIFTYYEAMNTDRASSRVLGSKYRTYTRFKPYFKRDIVCVKGDEDKEQFLDFCTYNERFIVKPVNAALGRGIRLVNVRDWLDKEALFKELRKEKNIICEELIVQDPRLAQIHPGSVNSLRVFTYFNGETTTIVCAWLKAGRGNAAIDNAGAGGMLAAIDETTGIVTTDASDEMARTFETHPDTGFRFKGFQIPHWEELIDMLKKMAPLLPGVPMIGWDVALSAEKGWQVIEGNEMGQLNLIQIATKTGMRKLLTERFEWSKHKQAAAKAKK